MHASCFSRRRDGGGAANHEAPARPEERNEPPIAGVGFSRLSRRAVAQRRLKARLAGMKLAVCLNGLARRLFRWRYIRFCTVGTTGLLLEMLLLYLLLPAQPTPLRLNASKIAAAEAAILNNFLWNEIWTFRGCGASGWKARVVRLVKFNLICAVGVGWSTALLNLQVYGMHWNVYLSNFNAIVVLSGWNFLLNAKLGWRVVKFRPCPE
jgi:putative flippase GtrA